MRPRSGFEALTGTVMTCLNGHSKLPALDASFDEARERLSLASRSAAQTDLDACRDSAVDRLS